MKSIRDIAQQAHQESRIPDVMGERCVHSLAEIASCRACLDACPREAWVLDEETLGIDTEACDGCGLCSPVCPQDAVEQQYEIAVRDWEGKQLGLCACERTGLEKSDGGVPCIHAFGLREILQLYRKGVRQVLYAVADCEQCERGKADLLPDVVGRLNWGLLRSGMPALNMRRLAVNDWKTAMTTMASLISGPQLSRRGFFRNLARTGLQTGLEKTGLLQPESGDGRFPGRLLLVREKQKTCWPFLPEINSECCVGCDACIRLCPHAAISITDSADGLYYSVAPENCTGCGLCQDVCEHAAVTVRNWRQIEQDRIPLRTARCKACGAPFHIPVAKDAGDRRLCRICAKHNHYKNLYQVLD